MEEESEEHPPGARPRRASQLSTATKIKPLPPFSSFFIFSHTNRYVCVPQAWCTHYTTHNTKRFLNIINVSLFPNPGPPMVLCCYTAYDIAMGTATSAM